MLKLALIGLTTLSLGGGYALTRSHCERGGCPLTETVSMVSSTDTAADPATKPTTHPTTGPTDAPVNKICPINKEEVDPAVFTMYEGKKIAFCCSGCIDTFKADPEKYMKDLK